MYMQYMLKMLLLNPPYLRWVHRSQQVQQDQEVPGYKNNKIYISNIFVSDKLKL